LKKNWRLRLVGWGDETYREELSALVEPGIILDGPLYGTDKDLAFRTASAFVLPSLSEGFPMAVLEAWSYGLPTLISKECNIPEGFEADSAIETGTSQEKILQSIVNFLRMSNTQMEDMGARGRRLVEEKFTWPLVASKMNSTYEWLLGKKERPECVILE
jgi:poly(glycerol-phosphate) alpha-glucosyltransferase